MSALQILSGSVFGLFDLAQSEFNKVKKIAQPVSKKVKCGSLDFFIVRFCMCLFFVLCSPCSFFYLPESFKFRTLEAGNLDKKQSLPVLDF
jgi:hypothetical protein